MRRFRARHAWHSRSASSAFDHELQTLELRSIFDYGRGRLSFVANPSIEFVTRGSDEGLEPVFDLSARAACQLFEGAAITTDYFSALRSGWELGVSAGHCVTSAEPWLMKSVIRYRF